MAKQSGLGDGLLVSGYDLSGDIGSLQRIAGGPAALDVTGINKSAFQRIGGLRDGGIDYNAFFNPSNGIGQPASAHERLSLLPTTDQHVTYLRGTGLGSPAACIIAKQIDYAPTRADDGALTIAVQSAANGFGLEWGVQATPGIRDDTAATDGDSIDLGTGSTAFGLQAWLHVTEFTGTDVTISLEESSDDGAVDTFAAVTGGAFTEITAGPAAERIQTARDQTVERYLRVVTTGTFDSVSFLVVVTRNATEVLF